MIFLLSTHIHMNSQDALRVVSPDLDLGHSVILNLHNPTGAAFSSNVSPVPGVSSPGNDVTVSSRGQSRGKILFEVRLLLVIECHESRIPAGESDLVGAVAPPIAELSVAYDIAEAHHASHLAPSVLADPSVIASVHLAGPGIDDGRSRGKGIAVRVCWRTHRGILEGEGTHDLRRPVRMSEHKRHGHLQQNVIPDPAVVNIVQAYVLVTFIHVMWIYRIPFTLVGLLRQSFCMRFGILRSENALEWTITQQSLHGYMGPLAGVWTSGR